MSLLSIRPNAILGMREGIKTQRVIRLFLRINRIQNDLDFTNSQSLLLYWLLFELCIRELMRLARWESWQMMKRERSSIPGPNFSWEASSSSGLTLEVIRDILERSSWERVGRERERC